MNKDYFLKEGFRERLENDGDKQPDQSKEYITSLAENVLKPYGLESIIISMDKAIQEKDKTITKLYDLHSWLSKASAIMQQKNISLNGIKSSPSSISQYCSVLKKYINFLKEKTPDNNTYKKWGAKEWKNNFSNFKKDVVREFAVDGYDSIISAINNGNKDNFVRLAINSSYFFCKSLVELRHKEILDNISENEPLIARKSTSDDFQSIQNNQLVFLGGIPIIIDPDGNKAVRDLIESTTGYTVSSGYDNLFVNYKISHIWGNAFDPRFFTSLWNIVLVPSWANDLLDKHGSSQDLALKMINTYKAICERLYLTNQKWQELGISGIATQSDRNFVVKGDFSINRIENKADKPFGTIKRITVTIE